LYLTLPKPSAPNRSRRALNWRRLQVQGNPLPKGSVIGKANPTPPGEWRDPAAFGPLEAAEELPSCFQNMLAS